MEEGRKEARKEGGREKKEKRKACLQVFLMSN
jgi:hypothetical protein